MRGKNTKIIIIATIAIIILLFFLFDLDKLLTLENLKNKQLAFQDYYQQNRVATLGLYFILYVVVTALSLPGAAIMTLAGGALFGFWTSILTVSFASTIGATLAFIISRYLLKETVQKRFGDKLGTINAGIEKDGAFYLFSLRLVPLFPFFLINLVMGLTPVKTSVFYIASQLGMLPGTAVFVNAGTELGKIDSLQGIISPGIIFSFVLLALFPLIAKKALAIVEQRKALASYPKPEKFEYNLVVIGAGSAGLVSSYIASAVKAKVALIEKHKMGGDCLNTGCVPSKALLRSAKILSYAARAEEFGLEKGDFKFNFPSVMARVHSVIKKIEPHDSVERYSQLGVECLQGEAKVTSPYSVEVDGRTLTTRRIIIASGARPFVPSLKGLDTIDFYTSDTIWSLNELPEKLLVLGGGPIGCEMTQAFQRLGSQVTQIEMGKRLMPREDEDVSAIVLEAFRKEGVTILTSHTAVEIVTVEGRKELICETAEKQEIRIAFDALLIAVGRAPNTQGMGLEELGVKVGPRGHILTNSKLQTDIPTIYAAGDVAGPYQFTHTAAHQAWYASVNALFSPFKSFTADYRVIPWCTFVDPEVARVGINVQEAEQQNIPYEVTTYGLDDLDRAIADSEDHGFVRVLTKPGSDKILGVTIVGSHAGDLISEYVLAMKHKLGLNKILGTIHIYPTMSEANKYVAGEWKRNHAPEKILRWIERYHQKMRG